MYCFCCSSLTRTARAIPVISKSSYYYNYFYGRRRVVSFFSTSSNESSSSSSSSSGLGGVDGIRAEQRRAPKSESKSKRSSTTCSSWDDSADRFFSRNNKEEEEEEELEKRTKVPTTPPPFSLRPGSPSVKEHNRRERWTSNTSQEYKRNSLHHAQRDIGEEQRLAHNPRWDRSSRSSYRDKQDNWGRNTCTDSSSSVPKMLGQAIYGVAPVLAALTVGRREFHALYVQEGQLDLAGNKKKKKKKKDKKGLEKVIKSAEKMGLNVIQASKHDLNMVVDNRPHQGLVLDASPLEMLSIRELDVPALPEDCKALLWLALDEVMDPQNLGAIIRSAYFFGAQGVVLCAKNSAPLSGVVSKASAGSLELIELRSCKNMMQFLSSSIENGWRVLGGSVSSTSLPLNQVESGLPTILVLGSEGTGLRPLVERSCTHLVRIPGDLPVNQCPQGTEQEPEEMDQNNTGRELKSFLAVESLNVSVAAGVLLYHLVGNNTTPLVDTKTDVTRY